MIFTLIIRSKFNDLIAKNDKDYPDNDLIFNSYRISETKGYFIEAPDGYEVMINGIVPDKNSGNYYKLNRGDIVSFLENPNVRITKDGWYLIGG
jgi:hypothetical protein